MARADRRGSREWFCSRECQNRTYAQRKRRRCPTCNREHRRRGMHAGETCKTRQAQERRRKPGAPRCCEWCGAMFRVSARRIRYKGDDAYRFCSRHHWYLSRMTYPLDDVEGRRARVEDQGYVQVWWPEHHRAGRRGGSRGWVFHHVIVAERILGRRLEPGEVVRHANGVKHDNRPENLFVKMTLAEVDRVRRIAGQEVSREVR